MRKCYLFVLFAVIVSSCGFVYEEQICGNYYLIAVDTMNDLSLSYHYSKFDTSEGIVSDGIYYVATNNDYIIIKKHPYIDEVSRLKLDEGKTDYYIVKVDKDSTCFDESTRLGPYIKDEFEHKIDELKITDLHEVYSSD